MNPVKAPTQLRLTQDLLDRADALIEVMAVERVRRICGHTERIVRRMD